MSYKTQALLTQDNSLINRIIACASLERIPDAVTWVYSNRWALSAQPGWDAAYASALAANPSAIPGDNEAVITDGMILSAVQAMYAR